MKILVSSHAFAPSIGGIETVTRLLAVEFAKLGHEIAVVTQTPSRNNSTFPFPIVRQPGTGELFRLARWCDIFWHNNLSLRTIWPALLLGKPVVITHQGSYCERPAGVDLALRVKRAIARRITSVAISKFVASCFDTPSRIILNPYDAWVFTIKSTSPRARDLVFVGRAVSEKGIDLVLESLRALKASGLRPTLTVVGSGPELSAMQSLAQRLGVGEQVDFIGAKSAGEVADVLNQHRILVVPSRYAEPFGVVALEGIACGCVVIGSSGGGLPEAIGPCGITFRNGEADLLAQALAKLLTNPEECTRLIEHAPKHLAQFHPTAIANAYLDLFRSKLS